MAKTVVITGSLNVVPSRYIGGTFTTNSNYPPSNGFTNTSSTTYARFTTSTTRQSASYGFDVSEIPQGATISNLTCSLKVSCSRATSMSVKTAQLYAGTTAKGGTVTLPGSSQVLRLTGSTWTREELDNLQLRFTAQRSGNNSAYIFFYGANLQARYTASVTSYEITSSCTTNLATISPSGSTELISGSPYSLEIYTDDLNGIEVLDNGSDVTSRLEYVVPTGSYTFNGIPTSYDSANSHYDSIYEGSTSDGLAGHTSTSRICAFVEQTAYADAQLTYNFDCSEIPANAIIDSVTCVAAAACYSNGQYFDTRSLQLHSGTAAKGTAVTITGTGNTRTEHNIDGGSWTRSELNNAKIVIYIKRGNNTAQASFSFWGATLTVVYHLPGEAFYRYSIASLGEDHNIVVQDNIIIPPEEDPDKTYHSLTISSINATTTPGRGTTRVESGSNQTITIVPSDPQITLVTDNGVDITNQLVAHGGTIPTPTVVTAPNASYGFAENNSGYYESQNKGESTSAAVCIVNFNLPVRCLVTINYINYAEATYDFGIFGDIDVPLNNNYKPANGSMPDSDYKLACNTSAYNTSAVQTLTYEIPAGQHSIYIKFSKDEATNSNNDTLQFKIASIEALEPNNYYTYDLSNINQDHSLVFIFGNVSYYFVNSSCTGNAKLFPAGQMVQLPGDDYRLTIVPENTTDTVTLVDNNVDRTSYLVRKEVETEKDGQTITVVNYLYTLENIQATHNIVVSSATSVVLKRKINGTWVAISKAYKKEGNLWVEYPISDALFDEDEIYVNS